MTALEALAILPAHNKVVGTRFSKNKRFDRSRMTVGRTIP
jgi:hypothetical protein